MPLYNQFPGDPPGDTVSRSQNCSLTFSRDTDLRYHIFTSTKTKEVVVIDETPYRNCHLSQVQAVTRLPKTRHQALQHGCRVVTWTREVNTSTAEYLSAHRPFGCPRSGYYQS